MKNPGIPRMPFDGRRLQPHHVKIFPGRINIFDLQGDGDPGVSATLDG